MGVNHLDNGFRLGFPELSGSLALDLGPNVFNYSPSARSQLVERRACLAVCYRSECGPTAIIAADPRIP